MNNIHTISIDKNRQTCPNRWNMHILSYEQAVYERSTKNGIGVEGHSHVGFTFQWRNERQRPLPRGETKPLLFKELRQKGTF